MAQAPDPAAALAVELGGEHPGALVDDETLAQADQEAAQATEAAVQAREMVDNTPAARLLRMTHYAVPGPTGFMWLTKADISSDLNDEALTKISKQVMEGVQFDERSRSDWLSRSSAAMDLALQVTENKTWPWQGAANIQLPLITTAAIQFHARAYPAIVPGQQICKGVPVGHDPDGAKMERGDRVGKHLSYQVLEEMPEWEENTDKLLLNVAIVGCAFRKTYFDHTLGANRSEMVTAKNLIVNHKTKNLTDGRRVTEVVALYKNDIEERIRSKRFREVDLNLRATGEDDDPTHDFYECHTWYDLDQDGYREPYICVVHKESQQVVRVTARFEAQGVTVDEQGRVVKIVPEHYYTKFALIPNPDGGFYDIGLGYLLTPLNEAANTFMNQMADAGTLANLGGGFIGQGLRLKGGPVRVSPGEYVPVDAKGAAIKENLVPLTFQGPSTVLFQLLGLIIEMAKEVASVKDVLTGQTVPANQPATTTLALIDQGLKVFTAIYKRLHRSLKQEFKKLARLNALFLDPEVYFQFQDIPMQVLQADYQQGDFDIVPVTDPSVVAGPVKLIKAQALIGLVGRGLNDVEIYRRFLAAIEEPNIEKILPQEDPDAIVEGMLMRELTIRRAYAELEDVLAGVDQKIAKSIKDLVDAAVTQSQQAQLMAQTVQGLSEGAGNGGGKKAGASGGRSTVGAGNGKRASPVAKPSDNGQGAPVSGGVA
jgi:chaperonin GroES